MSNSGKKFKVNFPYHCDSCGRDMEFVHIINIEGDEFAICDCQIKKLKKESLVRFIDRLEYAIPAIKKEYQEHLTNVTNLISELKKP